MAILFLILGACAYAIFIYNYDTKTNFLPSYKNNYNKRYTEGFTEGVKVQQQKWEKWIKDKTIIDANELEYDGVGLKDLKTFKVVVMDEPSIDIVWPDYKSRLKTIIELALRKEGINIVDSENEDFADKLYLTINAIDIDEVANMAKHIAGNISLEAKSLLLDKKNNNFLYGQRWDYSYAFIVSLSEANRFMEKATNNLLDSFINDYLKANPKVVNK